MGEGEVEGFECREVLEGIGGVLCFEGAVGGVGVEDLETEVFVLEEDGA